MDYSIVSKIEKAKRYVDEREERIHFESFSVNFQGDHNQHHITFHGNQWQCDCEYFQSRGVCSHTMALERILQGMIPGPGETQ